MTTETFKEIEAVYAETRQQWRDWLQKNSQTKEQVFAIIYHKKSETPSVTYVEAVEEALCFGWIDSISYKRDAESTYQRFSRRKAKSNWSPSNIERVERLTAAGLMTEHGQKFVDLAKQEGKWDTKKV
jgi:uncharacterized protein YdeI (YjbR/CyaY-like superfamily)